jgi:RimJ/RimL family protein N-acetyltransferase
MKRRYLGALHRTFDALARSKRYFVRPEAPSRSRLKQIALDADKRDLPFYVALHGDKVVGWVCITFPTIEALSHSGTVVIGVLPGYRRQGIGSRLLERAVAHAFQNEERRRIQLEVFSDNTAAAALYEKHGFKVEGVARNAVCLEGKFRDVVHMAQLKSD